MVKSTIALTSASFATSARMNAAAPPSCWISATTLAPSFSRLPERTTLAPTRANSVAVVLPMPNVPPVTSATLSENFFLFIQFPFAVVEFPKGETATSFFRSLVSSFDLITCRCLDRAALLVTAACPAKDSRLHLAGCRSDTLPPHRALLDRKFHRLDRCNNPAEQAAPGWLRPWDQPLARH